MLTALEFNQVPAQEAAFRSEIRKFLNEALVGMPSHAKARSWMGTSDDFSKKLAKQGWLGLTIPKEYGGSGKGFFSRFVLSEELLASGVPVASHWIADRQSGPLLLRYGTEAQRQKPRRARWCKTHAATAAVTSGNKAVMTAAWLAVTIRKA